MPDWVMWFGPCPPSGDLGWRVEREDGMGPTLVCAPHEFEEAGSLLVRRAIEDDAAPVLLSLDEVGRVVRSLLDR